MDAIHKKQEFSVVTQFVSLAFVPGMINNTAKSIVRA